MSFCEVRRALAWVTVCFVWFSQASAECQVEQFGTQPNFDLNKFSGTWYEIYWLPKYYESVENYWIDYTEFYSVKENGKQISVIGMGRPNKSATKCLSYERTMNISQDNSAKMYFMTSFNDTEKVLYDYWVISTDYDNWAYMYGCDWLLENGTCHKPHGVVWSRKATLEDSHRLAASAFVMETCLDLSDFLTPEQQKSCFETSGSVIQGPTTLLTVLVFLLCQLSGLNISLHTAFTSFV